MKYKVLMKGPFLSLSGYGYQARFALKALLSRPELFDIYIENTGWGTTSWITEGSELKDLIKEKIIKTLHYKNAGGEFDVNLQVTIPNEIEKRAPVNILYTAGIETTKVAPQWLEAVNQIDKVIVVSNHSKQIFKNTQYGINNQAGQRVGMLGLKTPVDVVNYSVQDIKSKSLKLDLPYDFNFLTMAQWGPRKDVDGVIRAFLHEFWEDEVGLVCKTFLGNNSLIDRTHVTERLEHLLEEVGRQKEGLERKCKLHLLHGAMSNAELFGLYKNKNIKAFVTATHGEGFGLSLFESAYSGLPVVAPGWSGQCDFLFNGNKPLFTQVDYTLNRVQKEAVWEGVIQEDSLWCYVDIQDLCKKMRSVKDDYTKVKKQAKELKNYLLEEFTEEKKYGEFVESIVSVLNEESLSDEDIDEWLNDMNIIEAD